MLMVILFYRIDVIMLNEQFDASLVILRKRFCWNYTDIFFAKKNVHYSAKKVFTDENAEILRRLNHGDQLLYNALNETWYKQPEVQVPDFWDEVITYILIKVLRQQIEWLSNRGGGCLIVGTSVTA